ncbi:MAG: hypothetical protein ABIF01_05850, partial [Candidatus Micrarchaeota archaeon]
MEKSVQLLFILLVSAVLLFGCSGSEQTGDSGQAAQNGPAQPSPEIKGTPSQPSPQTGEPEAKPPEPKPAETKSKDFSSLYSYSTLKSYEYRVTTASATGQNSVTNIKTTVSSDSYEGTPAWLTQTDMSTEG